MSSKPPIFYWRPGTLAVLEALRAARAQGLLAWATMDAGANVHVICPPSCEREVTSLLQALPGVTGVLLDGVGEGPEVQQEHLF